MSDIKVYMSPVEPPVIENNVLSGQSSSENELTIKMVPEDQSSINITVPMLNIADNYIMALWDPESPYISWERTYISNPNGNTSPQSSISITVKQPHKDITIIPYWKTTIVSAKNPDEITNHYPYIVKWFRDLGITLGEVPNSSKEEENFNKTVIEERTYEETQPIVRPGEYINVQWECFVNGKTFSSPIFNIKYETPLFTGGWIRDKTGESVDTTYSVEVFGDLFTGIVPTDFYDYQVGKWVYLLKADVKLTLDPNNNNKQLFDSSSAYTGTYKIVPFNFKGPMNTSCAIPFEDSLELDSAVNFEEVFDMVSYYGTISNIDYENNTGTVDVPGLGSTPNVPIFYHCDGTPSSVEGGSGAFEEEDEVVVEVPNNDWDNARIIGFSQSLKVCNLPFMTIVFGDPEEYLTVGNPVGFIEEAVFCSDGGYGNITFIEEGTFYGEYIKCDKSSEIEGETSGRITTILSCLEKYYERLYNVNEILYNKTLAVSALYGIKTISSFDISPLSNTNCLAADCSADVVDWWSKTYDSIVVTAFVHFPEGCTGTSKWSISVSHSDNILKFPSNNEYEPSNGYARFVCTSTTCSSYTNTHIGFDIYSIGAGKEKIFYVGMIDDQLATLQIYQVDIENSKMILFASYPTNVHFSDSFKDIDNNTRHVRLMGYGYKEGKHEIEFAAPGFSSETIKYTIYDETLSETVTDHAADIITGVWNPLTKTVHYVKQDIPDVYDPIYSDIGSRLSSVMSGPNEGRYCYAYYTSNWNVQECPGFYYTLDGWPEAVYIYDGQCGPGYPQGYDSWSGAYTDVWLEQGTDTDYGNFDISGNLYGRGAQTHYSKLYKRTTTRTGGGRCNSEEEIAAIKTVCKVSNYVPLNKKDYVFLGGVFNTNSISFKYKEIEYVEMELCEQGSYECSDEKNTVNVKKCKTIEDGCPNTCYDPDCYCGEYDWEYYENGGVEKSAISDTFPYDTGWKSICLSGKTKQNEEGNQIDISNWVIYKNIDSDSLFLLDNGGTKIKEFDNERAFFKEQFS